MLEDCAEIATLQPDANINLSAATVTAVAIFYPSSNRSQARAASVFASGDNRRSGVGKESPITTGG